MQTVAPFLAAWRRRAGNRPGPASAAATGEASTGDPVQIELWVRGTWIDITSYCLVRDNSGRVDISQHGIRAEGSQAEPAVGRLQLKNPDARFSPRNPEGPYYGAIGRNTPMRISVPDGNGGKAYRLWGEVSEWAPGWDPTGTDVWVDVTVSGILRRLTQGPAPAHSPMYVALSDPFSPNLRAYWPCEDASTATSVSSPLPAGNTMTVAGSPSLAGYSGFAGTDPVVLLQASSMAGTVGTYPDPAMTQVRFQCFIPAAGLTDGKVICSIDQEDYSAGSAQFWELFYTTTGNTLWLRMCASDGTLLGIELQHTLDVRGRSLYVSVELQETGTGITRTLRLYDLTTKTSYDVADTAALTSLSRITRIQFGPASRSAVGPLGTTGLTGVAIGHVTVEDVITPINFLGAHLTPIGETAGRRVQRICGEEGIGFESIGDLDASFTLGDQEKVAPLELMRQAELADTGMLFESRVMLGLGYRTGPALCNQDPQLTLNYAGFNLAEIPTPVEDDRYIANQVTVTVGGVSETYSRTDGVLSTQLPPAGVGVYGTTVTLNLASSDDADTQAAWRVHMGTVDEPRYPQISVNLAHPTFTSNPALRRAVLALRQGDRVLVQNVPDWLPPGDVDQIVLGFEETITHFEHRITLVCAPASPYQVGVSDVTAAIVDTDGSDLVEDASSAATALTVEPSPGQSGLWTTDAANLPLDVRVGGEIMRVTNITDWLTDTGSRSVSNGWGTPDVGAAWTVSGGSASDYAANGSALVATLSTVDVSRRTAVTAVSPDFDVYCDVTTSALATGDSLYGAVTGRMLDSGNMYMLRLEFTTANTIVASLRRLLADVNTQLGTYTLSATHVAGTYIRTRFQIVGSALKAKAYLATDPEPADWNITAVDSTLSAAYSIGTRSIRVTGNTNAAGVAIQHDNFRVVRPQTFTVTRSINGVVKAQVAGEDLRLAFPTIAAL